MEAVPGIADLAGADAGFGRLGVFGLRMKVWWSKDRLTRALANGAASIDSRELALRAGQITAKHTREIVASSIDDVLEQAARPKVVLSSQIPIDRAKVKAVSEALTQLADRLRSREPVRPQGMALVLSLLTDPERPLFGLAGVAELSRAIIRAGERLDGPSAEDGP
jgi:hypothetical protein